MAILTFDLPGRPVNVIHQGFFPEISGLIDRIESDESITAVVIRSGKEGSFVAGADLDLVDSFTSAEQAREFIESGHVILNRIAESPKTWIAAIHGAAMGGGLELALACHGRIVTDDPETVLALPEVMLGLLPAGGGTQRLPRLLGLPESLKMMLTGAKRRARKAKAMGLADEICGPSELIERAVRLARSPIHRSMPFSRWATLLPIVRRTILRRARHSTLDRTRGRYPAPVAILDCVSVGLAEGPERGLEKEAEQFGRLATGREAQNLIWLFNATNELKKRPTPDALPVAKVGIVGAGLMGEGIASVSLPIAEVVLEDVSEDALGKARNKITASLDKRATSGAVRNRDEQLRRLRMTRSLDDLENCDLVIEAVFESLELKKKIFREAAEISPGATLASNTSAIPISAIGEDLPRPERLVGMHYFSPVPKMPLLEIVRAGPTAEETVDTAVRFGVDQGKIPIVVGDGPGFYTTRILAPLINEAVLLVEEGVPVTEIDEAMKNAGFPVGPITLLDEVGIDVAAHVSDTLGKAFAARGHRPSSSMKALVAEGLLGRKSGEGFYVWRHRSAGGRTRPSRRALDLIEFEKSHDQPEPATVSDRCVLALVNEAAQCRAEGIIDSPLDGDVGAIMGVGFPPFHGGPFHYIDRFGAKAVVSKLRSFASKYGERFEPAEDLVEMAKSDGRYYD
ncbi:MAG: 3-hydroxyacyl-CoA dehydrogenase NAD-binding domain-containing protein [Thermoanaerobaculia bacterium]|nr:3-hydroxyacyl-CoA dehydrogenase NAD-binding domain-containing protein [Thermoanaerobaculia bacterium]